MNIEYQKSITRSLLVPRIAFRKQNEFRCAHLNFIQIGPSRKAIMPDWLKWAVIILIFLAVAAVILWQVYNSGLDIIKNPGVFKFKV
ncbi:MAG: hypothetical protein HYT16_01935 [DPANN group archaeon]|nr:hypothetical protein [DPANN group archaeon]